MHCGASNFHGNRMATADSSPRPKVAPPKTLKTSTGATAPATSAVNYDYGPPTEIPTRLPVNGKPPASGVARVSLAPEPRKTLVLNGHSEYVMQVMRDFFKVREANALIELFRSHDSNKSGTLEYDEFRQALLTLNLDLTEKDFKSLYQIADADSSGSLEFSEFFNNFRSDDMFGKVMPASPGKVIKREPFFWSKTRPRSLLPHSERVKLQEELVGRPSTMRSKDELMSIIQSRVTQSDTREVFSKFDENHSGRLTAKEFQLAMRDLQVDVSEPQAEEVITAINEQNGSSMRTHITYPAFANAFNNDNLDSIGGLQNTTHAERPSNSRPGLLETMREIDSPMPTPPPQAPLSARSPRRPGTIAMMPTPDYAHSPLSSRMPIKPMDTLSKMGATAPPLGTIESTLPVHSSGRTPRPPPAVEAAETLAKLETQTQKLRLDMLGAWRGVDGNNGDHGHLNEGDFMRLGRDIDWTQFLPRDVPAKEKIFRVERAEAVDQPKLPPLTKAGYARGAATAPTPDFFEVDPAVAASQAAAAAVELAGRFMGGVGVERVVVRDPEIPPSSITPRASLCDVRAVLKTNNIRECMEPPPGAPGYASGPDQHKRVEAELLAEQVLKREQLGAVRQAQEERYNRREQALDEAIARRERRVQRLDSSRITAKAITTKLVSDSQLVTESRDTEQGTLKVAFEPPSTAEWRKPAAPHLTSHWETIGSRHHDPPARKQHKMLTSYRRAYPHMENRPWTPPSPRWGGCEQPTY